MADHHTTVQFPSAPFGVALLSEIRTLTSALLLQIGLCVVSLALHDIFHILMAQYSLFVPLNTNQLNFCLKTPSLCSQLHEIKLICHIFVITFTR